MNIKTLLNAAALGAGISLMQGCGGENSPGSGVAVQPPTPPQTQMLDTQQVLALARVTSETSDPAAVGNGGIMVADAEDNTSDPIPVG